MMTIVELALLSTLFISSVIAQATLEQCTAEICCTNGNEDLSASCWNQCSQYQAQLAEVGCHILPPLATSSSAPPVAPTVTTIFGPGQFCQAYGPGEGGDTCTTIPAGCYVVPSGYNVVPQLYCTATVTSSSSVASSTPLIMQITSSSMISSSSTPSSSVIPSSSTPIPPSSSLTPIVSSSVSSASSSAMGPPATTLFTSSSSASVPPILTSQSSATTSTSTASSSAVQSSALPGIVGGVATSAASASSAAQAFSQNPTIDTANALKQAVSAAQDAATAAKALADAAAFTALSAELATVLTSLSEAAATLASAETLADIAAAVAPEIAAAEAAAATAQAIEEAGPDSPEATAQQVSANQPSATQPSPTNSASSAAGSSVALSSGSVASSSSAAATASFITSASAVSTTGSSLSASASISSAVTVSSVTSGSSLSTITSSATASASTCDACVACADSTIAPIPTSGPVDPFSQWADTITDNSTSTKSRKRFQNTNFVKIEARAATRDVEICGQFFSAPSYNSYNGAGNGNSYSPYYSYLFTLPRCSTYEWTLTQKAVAPDRLAYATEHIYELQLIALFLRWLSTNNASLKAYLAVNNRNICANFVNQILFGQGQQWTVLTFGAGGSIKTPGSRPIDELMSQMSGGTRSNELVYLETHLNGMKAQLFGGKTPSSMTVATAALALVGESSAVYLYLQDPNVSAIFKAVSNRVKTFYAKLDTACGRSGRGPCAANVQWANSYHTWQAQYLQQIDAGWQAWMDSQIAGAVSQITPKASSSAMWQALLNAVNTQYDSGLLSENDYTFSAALTI